MEKQYYQKHSSVKGLFFVVYNQILYFFLFFIFIVPLSNFCKPKISFVKTVLPDPFGPRITAYTLKGKA